MYEPEMSDKAGWLYGVVEGKGYFYKPYLKGKEVKFKRFIDKNFSTPFKFTRTLVEVPAPFFEEEEDCYEPDWSQCEDALFWVEKKGEAFFVGVKWCLTNDGTLLYESFFVQDNYYNGDATYDGEVVLRYKSLT